MAVSSCQHDHKPTLAVKGLSCTTAFAPRHRPGACQEPWTQNSWSQKHWSVLGTIKTWYRLKGRKNAPKIFEKENIKLLGSRQKRFENWNVYKVWFSYLNFTKSLKRAVFHLGRESHLREHAAAGAQGVLQKIQLWRDAQSSWAVTAPTELLQGHRAGHTGTAPSTTALKK